LCQLSRKDERWRATTATGSVTAERVILAVNGLIETFGFYRHRLMHINLYASMTRELSPEEGDELGGDTRWGFTPSDPIGSTVRRIDGSGGTRLVIRNRCTYEPHLSLPADRLQPIAEAHARTFYRRFPMLKQVEMEPVVKMALALHAVPSPASLRPRWQLIAVIEAWCLIMFLKPYRGDFFQNRL
jgi:glycine/D-amino acid oxidase-like deaminating enzyme